MATITPLHLNESLRFLRRRLFYSRHYRFSGSGESICRQIVESCWNGKYFQVSNGNHAQFYSRDIGWCSKSLVSMGYRTKLLKTLSFALDKMSKSSRIPVALTPAGIPFDFPNVPSIDSAAYLLYALKKANAKGLVSSYSEFLEKAVLSLVKSSVDDNGLPKPILLSGMRDHSVRCRSCYDTASLGFLSKNLDALGLHNPLEKVDYRSLLKKKHWAGNYFLDDLSGKKLITADANIYPFYFEIVDDDMLEKAFSSIQDERLDNPLLVRYTSRRDPADRMLWTEMFVRGWEKNCYWPQLDSAFNAVLHKIDRKKAEERRRQALQLIEKHGTLFEVYNADGLPFKTPFYVADDAMIWAANYGSKRIAYK